jgi:MFS family permease
VLNFSQFAAVLVLSPWAGSWADRFDRRGLLFVTQTVAVVLAAGLAVVSFAGLLSVPLVILVSLALGVISAISAPAQLALVPSLVPDEEVPSAVGLNSMTFNLARALGPAAAALVIATLGLSAAFAVNALSYLLLVIALTLLRPRPQQRERGARLRESVRLVLDDRRLLAYLLIVAAVGYASDPVNTLAPAWANEFGHPDTWAGLIVGAFGAGAVTAAFLLTGRVAGSPRRMALTLTMLGGGIVLFALSPTLGLAFVFLFVAGFGYLASNTSATARLQLGVSESQRGRVMALWSIAFLGLRPFASLLDGALAAAFGVRVAGVVLALPALVGAAWIALRLRR